MIRQYRAWLPDQPESTDGFPILATSPEGAAKKFIEARDGLKTVGSAVNNITAVLALRERPQLVLVREAESLRQAPHRICVTAEIEIAVWGYPEELDKEERP